MYKLFIFVLLSCVIFSCKAQDEIAPTGGCDKFRGKPAVIQDLAILKTYLYPINLDDPEGDFEIRVSHGDYRLLAIMSLGPFHPSVDTGIRMHKDALCELGDRIIWGTSDAMEAGEHIDLAVRFEEYAVVYNKLMLKFYEENIERLRAEAKERLRRNFRSPVQ